MRRKLAHAWLLTVTPDSGPDTSGEGTHADPPPAPQLNEHGYPDGTPVKEMTQEQQTAYWRSMARKHEDAAKSRQDYDSVKAERDQLRQAGLSDQEKVVEAARAEGVAEGQRQASALVATSVLDTALASRHGITDDQRVLILRGFSPAGFTDDKGAVDVPAVRAYAATFGADAPADQWPDMGQGARGGGQGAGAKPTSVAEAMAQYRDSKTKK